MELGPIWTGRAEELSADVDDAQAMDRQPIQVPTGTPIQVWRTDHINQLLRLAHLAAKASNDLREAVLDLEFEFTPEEVGDAYTSPLETMLKRADERRSIECPRCGERKRIEVNLVDVGMGPHMEHMVGSYRCLNPECPTNLLRHIHAHPTARDPERTACCGVLISLLPSGAVTTTDPHNVTCPGSGDTHEISTTTTPEEGP